MVANIDMVENYPYISPVEDNIPIIASSPYLPGTDPTHEGLLEVADCGFNCVLTGPVPKDKLEGSSIEERIEAVKRFLSIANGTGLRVILSGAPLFWINKSDPNFDCAPVLKECHKYVEAFAPYKEVTGWFCVDEPKYDYFGYLTEFYDQIHKDDPSRMAIINLMSGGQKEHMNGLLPQTNPTEEEKDAAYMKYLKEFQRIFRPAVWSYDMYPIYNRKGNLEINPKFYYYLEIYSKLSKDTSRPFYAYVLSQAYGAGWAEFPMATVSYLRYEIFSALAYGAQGIVYWNYSPARRKPNEVLYRDALLNRKGKKTSSWYAAKQVNSEIKKYQDVFLGCELEEVYHTGKEFPGVQKMSSPIGPLKKVNSKGDGVMVSALKNGGKRYIVVVSQDPFHSQQLTLTFDGKYDIREVTAGGKKISGKSKKGEVAQSKEIKRKISSGGYLIFEYSEP